MRTPARRPQSRRSLVLLTALTLLLGLLVTSVPAVAASEHPGAPRVSGINVDKATIPELQKAMDRGRLTSYQLVRFYLKRIRKLDGKLNSVITINPKALRLARNADRARRHGDDRSLLGIPVIVKDNINTTGMETTAGSWALDGSNPKDAFIIKRLKKAGAIIIAKANLSEWANFRSDPSSSGWSGIGGQTNMAYVLDRNPCGSSSGTAVAVSADLAAVGVGTETDGSIVCPSGANSLVGVKPTVGLLSRAGIIPISAEQDTAGPMTRNVTDAAVVLGAMTGVDRNDPATKEQRGHAFRNYRRFLDKHALKGARIGVWRTGTYDPALVPVITDLLDDTVGQLEALGATVVDDIVVPVDDAYEPEFTALVCEFKDDLAGYLQEYTKRRYPKTLADLIAFNAANPDLEGPWNSALFELSEGTNGRDAACAEARATANEIARASIDDTLADLDLDAIVAPTNGAAWKTDPVLGDLSGQWELFVGSSSPSAISGYPNVTVPAGYDGPLPLGISFIAERWSEPKLLGFAYAWERATKVRVPPKFLPTLP
jgi:amidase